MKYLDDARLPAEDGPCQEFLPLIDSNKNHLICDTFGNELGWAGWAINGPTDIGGQHLRKNIEGACYILGF